MVLRGEKDCAPLAQIEFVSRPQDATYFAPRPKGLAPSARRGKVSKGAVKGKPFRMGFLLTIPFLNDQEDLTIPLDSP